MTAEIDNNWTVRAATVDDVDLVVDLINAVAVEETGVPSTRREDQLIEWGLPQFNIDTDTQVVFTAESQLVGFVQLWDSEPHDYRNRGIGRYLVEWAEARAWQSVPLAPPEARVSMHTSAVHENEATHQLFRVQGYTPARSFYRMVIDMEPGTPPPEPVWPGGN